MSPDGYICLRSRITILSEKKLLIVLKLSATFTPKDNSLPVAMHSKGEHDTGERGKNPNRLRAGSAPSTVTLKTVTPILKPYADIG